ncbi:MAG: DUF11 domain-containing protein [Bifidobacteriaceae bacterium]|jgi:uncharacterized repeat protein (TIGR01451 family)|nr:DUF11 domain-containing protein [Bifidobacteriaceae bacterium]
MSKTRRFVALAIAGVLVAVLAIANAPRPAQADNTAPFGIRYTANANGAILSIGNNLLTCDGTGTTICQRTKDGLAYDNNNFVMINLDADNDPTTSNSSSSTLALPDGATVLFAGLYWGARLNAGTSGDAGDAALADQMALKVPGDNSYQTIEGTVIARNTSQQNAYQSFKDVTDIVALAGNGDYWGANVEGATGFDRYAGWALTIAYTAPGYPLRNLTVFDGFNTVGSGSPQTIDVKGFTAPRDGPVDAQLSMVVYEGDLAQTGDYTLLNQTQLATAVSPGSNFFDSINSLNGGSVTTRTPAYRNMLGFDIKNLGVSGVIPNGATEATFSFSSAGDVYYPGVLALAINLYAPDFTSSTKTAVNLTSSDGAKPGDTLQYQITYTNTGQDPATDSRSCDPLPPGVDYVPSSLVLLSGPQQTGPVPLPDNGSGRGSYDPVRRQVCVNLGRDATASAGGTLNVADQTSFQFQATVRDDAGGTTLRNTAHLAYATGTTRVPAVFDVPPAVTPVALKADVSVTKTMLPNEAIAGQGGRTTLVVTNNGPNRATDVVVTDPLPADYVAEQVTWSSPSGPSGPSSGTCPTPLPGGQVVCQLPDLVAGQTVTVAINGAAAASSAASTLSNTASVAASSFDPDLSNNVASVSIPMTHQADLKIEKIPPSTAVTPGGLFTWTVKVTNLCSYTSATNPSGCLSDATGVSISDIVPDASRLVLTGAVGGTGAGGAEGDVAVTCPAAQVTPTAFTCSVDGDGRLRPGQTALVTVSSYMPGNLAGGSARNQAAVTSATFDPNQGNNITTASVMAGAAVNDVRLTKAGPLTVTAGTRVNYTLTAQNFGPSDASAVQVIDDLAAAGLTADSSTRAITDRGTCAVTTGAGARAVCDLGTLPGPAAPGGDGAIAIITVTGALVPAGKTPGSVITNTATITCGGDACPEPPGPDPNPDAPSVTTSVTALADLSVVKTSNKPTLGVSEAVIYTITVTNNGPSTATGVVLKDVLPGGVVLDSIDITDGVDGTCQDGAAQCSINDMAPGETSQITVVGTTGAEGPTTAVETATVSAATADPVTANNTATWTHGSSQADLALAKTSSWEALGGKAGPIAGLTGSYTLTVTNLGPNSAASPQVTDTIPDWLEIDASLPSGCLASGQALSCSQSGALQDGDSLSYIIPVKIDPYAPEHTPLANTATVTSVTPDPTDANNTSTVTDLVTTVADLEVEYAIGYDLTSGSGLESIVTTKPTGVYLGPGSVRRVGIMVTNHGPSVARDVQIKSNVVISALAEQTSFPSWCGVVNQELVCSLNDFIITTLAPEGSRLTFPFPLTIAPDAPPGDYPDCGRAAACPDEAGGWASVTTSTPDPSPANNFDTAGLFIDDPRTDLRMAKTALSTTPNPDETVSPHDSYVAGQKFGYQIDLWIPAAAVDPDEPRPLAADAANVQLGDTMPDGFLITQVNTSQGSCDEITTPVSEVNCSLGTVRASTAAGSPQLVTVHVYGTIAADTTAEISVDGGAINTAEAVSSTPDPSGAATKVTKTAATDVIQQGDLEVSKLADSAISYAGANVGYTVTVINNGPSDVDDAVVTDTLPLGLTLAPVLSPGCVVDGLDAGRQVIRCQPQLGSGAAGEIPANKSANVRIVATSNPRDLRPDWCPGKEGESGQECPEVLPPAGPMKEYLRELVNEVSVTASATDTKPGNNLAEVTTQMRALADIAVTAAVSTDTPSAGSEVTYTLNGVNLGPSTLDNPVVEATFPPGFQVLRVTEPYMNCSLSTTGSGATAVDSVRCVGWEATPIRDAFEPGITVPGTVTVLVPADTPAGQYTATARAFSREPVQCPNPDAGTCESDYTNNTASVVVNVVQVADTSIVKRLVEPVPVVVGRQVVYELDATNAGPSVAHNVTISDTVPAGLTYVSGQLVGGDECALPERIDEHNVIRCRVGDLAPEATKTARLVFQVDPSFRGEMCNSALVGSAALDLNASDNTGLACSSTVVPEADVGVVVTASWPKVNVGSPAAFKATVTNHGPWATANAVVTFTIPAGLTAVAIDPVARSGPGALAACTAAGRVFTCPIGDLAISETVDYRITGIGSGAVGSSLLIRAVVTHSLLDPETADDASEAKVVLAGKPGASGGSGGDSLPLTGADLAWPVGIGVALVLLGAAALAWRGRRRSGG